MAHSTEVAQSLPEDLQSAVALVQAQLRESVAAVDKRISELKSERKFRWSIAIVLKVISVLSGLVIATGFFLDGFIQVLGGAIAGVAALERVFANLNRLLAVAAAEQAYERIRLSVKHRHDRQIVKVVEYHKRKPSSSAKLLIRFVGELRDDIASKRAEIEDRLAKSDYENLGRLNLDEQVDMPA